MMRIECLCSPGCGSRQATMAMIREVVHEMGLDADIREVLIGSRQEAMTHRFLGSPSVRVNGDDVEPGADRRTDFGLG